MNNKEFATLLMETAESLNESGSRQKYIKLRRQEKDTLEDEYKKAVAKRDLKRIKEIEKLKDLNDQELARYGSGVDKSKKVKDPHNNDIILHKTTIYRKDGKSTYDAEINTLPSKNFEAKYSNENNTRSGKHTQQVTPLKTGEYYLPKDSKEEWNNYLKSLSKNDVSPIHIRVNNNKPNQYKKKSQNESIAILLTEAAELLNEGIFFNKKKRFKKERNR